MRTHRGILRPQIITKIIAEDQYYGMLEGALLVHVYELTILDFPRKMIDRWYLACAQSRETCIFVRDLSSDF